MEEIQHGRVRGVGVAILSGVGRKASLRRRHLLGKIPSRPGKEASHVESREAGERGSREAKVLRQKWGPGGVAVAGEEARGEHRAEQIMLGPFRTWKGSSG